MSICKRLLGGIIVIALYFTTVLPMQQQGIDGVARRIDDLHRNLDIIIDSFKGVQNIAIDSNIRAGKAAESIQKSLELLKEIEPGIARAQAATANLGQEYDKCVHALREEVALRCKTLEAVLEKNRGLSPADTLNIRSEALKNGIFAGEADIQAQAKAVADSRFHKEKIQNIKDLLGDPKFIMKIVAAITIIALCIYIIKYCLPVLINYMTKPRVISEISSNGWFGWFKPQSDVSINDLIFAPALHNQLQDLLVRVETAKKYNETLPNVLLYGDPGTGKTAFVRALAQASGLEYALTSGSEFAKITDLSQANEELRKLLTWAKKSKKGMIIFIDEAESLFANRKLPTTSKNTQDFINTFLSLVQDQSQKNLMFILATNHPFKLDDAVTNRIGKSIEFTLPEAPEREKILSMYLMKFAQENKEAIVNFPQEIKQLLPKYAEALTGLSPRAIKFVAEEMIIHARRQKFMQLTDDIAQAAIEKSKHSLQQTKHWEEERDTWLGSMAAVQS